MHKVLLQFLPLSFPNKQVAQIKELEIYFFSIILARLARIRHSSRTDKVRGHTLLVRRSATSAWERRRPRHITYILGSSRRPLLEANLPGGLFFR